MWLSGEGLERCAVFPNRSCGYLGVLDKEVEVGVRASCVSTSPTGELKRAVKSRESV